MNALFRMNITLLLVLGAAALGAETPADWPAGYWRGTLQAGEQELEIVYRLEMDADGAWAGSMDVPAQGASGLPLQSVEISGDSIMITMPMAGDARFRGRWTAAEERVEGRFSQAGQSFPMVLKRAERGEAGPVRPQEPKPPLPYRSESVRFSNLGTTLAGTVTLPGDDGRHAGVVLVSGAGPQDRDGTFMNHRPLLVMADHLTRAGFAVLRFDERGVGESEGDFATATAGQLAGDIAAAADFLRGHDSVDRGQVGIIAHSEGGRLSALAIENQQAADALVLLGAPALPGIAGLNAQAAQSPIAALQLAVAEASLRLEPGANPEPAMRAAAEQLLAGLAEDQLAAFGGNESLIVNQLVQALGQPQTQFTLSFDPRPALRSAGIPVLALYGSKDRQVDVAGAAEALRDALGDRGDVRTLGGLNHFFQEAESGAPSEYATIEQTISPVALTAVAEWLRSNAQ